MSDLYVSNFTITYADHTRKAVEHYIQLASEQPDKSFYVLAAEVLHSGNAFWSCLAEYTGGEYSIPSKIFVKGNLKIQVVSQVYDLDSLARRIAGSQLSGIMWYGTPPSYDCFAFALSRLRGNALPTNVIIVRGEQSCQSIN